jgi:hypothetical protein
MKGCKYNRKYKKENSNAFVKKKFEISLEK